MSQSLIELSELPELLSSLTLNDWQPLLDLIPDIEQSTTFGTLQGGDEVEDDVFSFPFYAPSPVVEKFEELCYKLGIIVDFDWPGWDEGRELASGDQSQIRNLDLVTSCKLITAIVRNNRFCDGVLVGAFESGLILSVLKRMQKLL
ncbi:MAG: hypothetical protein KAH17_00480 [Bacteroidales bacterium]|nr:hypothetical protein [Bacteroidales bacterium]